jgi:uncharacterized membrane protein
MNRMLVVVFGTEAKAFEARKVLRELDFEGTVLVYASAVVTKAANGAIALKQEDGGPVATVAGTSIGGLIGFLGGPAGAAAGAVARMTVGLISDLESARVGSDFVDEVGAGLSPGKSALTAEVDEDSTEVVDTRMEALGGIVHRRAISDVRDTANHEDTAAIKAEIAQTKVENGRARGDRKVKLEERMKQLEAKLLAQVQRAKQRREAARRDAQAKIALLKSRASRSQPKSH